MMTRAGLVVLVLLGAAACGGDDDDAGAGNAGAGDVTGQGDAGSGVGGDDQEDSAADTGAVPTSLGIDACALLQPSEIEAQFPEVGPVEVGATGTDQCFWDAEDESQVWVAVAPVLPGESIEDAPGADSDDVIEVAGLGDEAYYKESPYTSKMYVDAGDKFVLLDVSLMLDPEGRQEKVAALTELVLGRL